MNLSQLTTFKLGGPCREFVDCRTAAELSDAVRGLASRREKFLLVGGGSNLLAADAGVDSAVVRFANSVPEVRIEADAIWVSGATALDELARFTVEQGLAGLVCCSGIPGTVGGAVAGNAGAFGEQIGDRVISAGLMKMDGSELTEERSGLDFSYRKSKLPESGQLVLWVKLALEKADREALQNRRDEILAVRAAKHPDWRQVRTAGSFFKNIEPTSKADRRQAAGWFLEQVGAKDLRVGGARTFDRHANIVIAEDSCTATDVVALTKKMSELVELKFGLKLHREVRFVGNLQAP